MDDEIEYSASSAQGNSETYRLDFRKGTVEKITPNRRGWRARLANVERLLHDAEHQGDARKAFQLRSEALAEVRSMLDGESEERP